LREHLEKFLNAHPDWQGQWGLRAAFGTCIRKWSLIRGENFLFSSHQREGQGECAKRSHKSNPRSLWHAVSEITTPIATDSIVTTQGANQMGRFMAGGVCLIGFGLAAFSGQSMISRVDATLDHLGAANRNLTVANQQLIAANRQLTDMKSQLIEANKQLVATNRRLDVTQAHVATANGKIDKANDGIGLTINELGETKKALSQTNERLSVIDQVFRKVSLLGRK
jgi:peptidoglycan hydrolase CwlO-like protein